MQADPKRNHAFKGIDEMMPPKVYLAPDALYDAHVETLRLEGLLDDG